MTLQELVGYYDIPPERQKEVNNRINSVDPE